MGVIEYGFSELRSVYPRNPYIPVLRSGYVAGNLYIHTKLYDPLRTKAQSTCFSQNDWRRISVHGRFNRTIPILPSV